jgi:hypothetical protein
VTLPVDAQYSREYRRCMGFTNQQTTKDYLSAKDIIADIDYNYVDKLIVRLRDIYAQLNSAIHESVRHKDFAGFAKSAIELPYERIKREKLIGNLNNQGRRSEQVLFSWLRGYTATEFLRPAIAHVFQVDRLTIESIGDDDFKSPHTFRRTPRADLKVREGQRTLRLEVQAGFQGINDVKQHKWLEAKRVLHDSGHHTVCIHCDFYNGQVAFIRLSDVSENDVHWITRQQMEGQTVFNIDQNRFSWGLMNKPPLFDELELE